MSKLYVYLISMILLTILLLYLSISFLGEKNLNNMIKNNIVLDNIYIDNDDYIEKLENKREELKNELIRKYDTLDEVELKKIIDDINNDKADNKKYIADKNEEKN